MWGGGKGKSMSKSTQVPAPSKLWPSNIRTTGCSLNIVFFSEDFKMFWSLAFACFPSVFVCTHTRQVERQRCSRTGRGQKNNKILRKNHNIQWTPCSSKILSIRNNTVCWSYKNHRKYFLNLRNMCLLHWLISNVA